MSSAGPARDALRTADTEQRSDATLSYLALGDSYTIGEGVSADDRWPMQLAHALRVDNVAVADPRIIAVTGWTTDELSAAIDASAPLGTFGFVSLAIGVNDQYRGRSAADYRDGFGKLLQRAIGFADHRADRVVVPGIPDWGATVFGLAGGRDRAQIADALDAFNAVAQELCRQHGVAFVDLAPISRECGGQTEMLVDDGLHPSAAMYSLWIALLRPVALGLLRH